MVAQIVLTIDHCRRDCIPLPVFSQFQSFCTYKVGSVLKLVPKNSLPPDGYDRL